MRQEAIAWWNNLDSIEQRGYFIDYTESNFTPARILSELTGREVEIIYTENKKEEE